MPIIALIPVPTWKFGDDEIILKEHTDLPILQTFGRETVVRSDSPTIDILASGISAILDCTEEEAALKHPDAWFTKNPMMGPWYQLQIA